MGENSQNILDVGAFIVQRSNEEITGKVQKYARMDTRQFVPYSSWEEGYFISNLRGGAPKKSLCLQAVPDFLFKMYFLFWIFYLFFHLATLATWLT